MTDSNNRLDRIEVILAETVAIANSNARSIESTTAIANSNARAIQAADSRIAEVAELVERNANANALLRDAVDALVRVSDSTMARIDTQSEQITEMSSEIRGLQTENRRILDRLERRDTES